MPVYWEAERRGRDAENRPEMKLKITASFCFSKQISHIEYYHNSSWLEYGGSPDKAVRSGFTAAFDKYLRDNNKYTKTKIRSFSGHSGLAGTGDQLLLHHRLL